jgi:sugar/nucleoside kinase (ribokinase family)
MLQDPIVVCGPVAWNTLVYLDRLPEPRPQTLAALDEFETVGGTSAGKALHLAALGRRVHLRTVLGDDAAADRLRAVLEGGGIDLAASTVSGRSERHLNLMTPAGERVSVYLSVPAFVQPDAVEFTTAAMGASALVMDLSETSRALLPTAAATGIPIWTDLHDYDGESDFHHPFVTAARYLFLNADGMADPSAFMRARVEAGAQAVVCTLGAAGAMAFDTAGMHRVPAAPAHVRDTNGAGDAFLAGFLDATLAGAGTTEALAAAAAQATVALGSRHLHPRLDELVG